MHHGLFAIQHALIHIDVDNLSAVFNLLARNVQCFVEFIFANKPCKACGSSDVSPFTNVYE